MELSDIERRILRRYNSTVRASEGNFDNAVEEANRRRAEVASLVAQMDFFRRFAANWRPSVRIRPETLARCESMARQAALLRFRRP